MSTDTDHDRVVISFHHENSFFTTTTTTSGTCDIHHNYNFNQLKEKMRNHHDGIPFSMKFEEIHEIFQQKKYENNETIIQQDHRVEPTILSISQKYKFICVSDEWEGGKISILDLESCEKRYKLITSFKPEGCVSSICIDDDDDSMYIGAYGFTCKYSIKELLLNKEKKNIKPIWSIGHSTMYGMSIRRISNDQSELFRFNPHELRMEVMNPMNGELIRHFQLSTISDMSDIIFITPNRMIVSGSIMGNCYLFEKSNLESEWKLIKEIQQVNGIKICRSFAMTIDRVSQRIFITDYDNMRLIVLDYDGNVFETLGKLPKSLENQLSPYGLCFDERMGLLYISDRQHLCVRVFK